jgi:polyphosphate kinase
VELMVPIDDPACRRRLVGILETSLADTVKGRRIRADGGFDPPLHTGRPKKGLRSQQAFFEQACDSAEEARQTRATFEPHTPPPRREPER